jgi:hypothetical protein
MEVLVKISSGIPAQGIPSVAVAQIKSAKVDQVGQVILCVSDVLAFDQWNMQPGVMPWGNHASSHRHIIDQPETKVAVARQIDANF